MIKEQADKQNVQSDMDKKYSLKQWVFHLIVITIFFGLIVPFLSEVIFTIWFPCATVGLNTWNQFVSIILGIVATVLSIVSIIMGFKNYDDTLEIQEKYTQTLQNIERIAKDLDIVKNDVSKMALNGNVQTVPRENDWNQGPTEE